MQTHIHGINVIALQQFPIIRVQVLDLPFLAPGFQLFRVDITSGDYSGVRDFLITLHMLMGNNTCPNNTNTNFFQV